MMGKRAIMLMVMSSLLFLSPLRATAAQNLRPFTIDDFMKIKWIMSAQISPDGSRVLYTVAESDTANNQQFQSLWVISVKGGTPTKLRGGIPFPTDSFNPAWSPDSSQIAFTLSREGSEQLWLINSTGGREIKLTNQPTDIKSFAWSPSGKQLAFTMTEPGTASTPAEPQVVGQSSGGGGQQLYLVDVKTKELKQLTKGELFPSDIAWSPDGKQIAFAASGDLYSVAVESGQTRKLVERTGQDRLPRWSPDGSKIAFFSNYGKPGLKRGLSVVAASGGSPQDIYQDWNPGYGGYPPWFFDWSADGKNLYSLGLARMNQQLYALSTETGQARQVTSGAMVYHDFSLSQDRRTMAFLASDSTTSTEVYFSPVEEFKPKKLTTTNPQLEGVSFAKAEAVQWKSKDGLDVEGLLLKPIGYEPGKRYPLLVVMEGTFGSFDFSFTGRVSADSTNGFMFPFQPQIFASQGYAVLMPNPRGSWGYGLDFGTKALGDFGVGPYNDIMAGVDALITQGIADPERLGIMGVFVDAYRAVFALTQTNRFKAATLVYPIFNPVSWYGQLGPEATYADRYFGGAPWQVPQNYEKISPVNLAGKIKTPTLLVSMAHPDFLPVQMQAKEAYTALKRNNVPVEYVIYPKQDFGVNKPRSFVDLLKRNLDWCDRWIKGEEK